VVVRRMEPPLVVERLLLLFRVVGDGDCCGGVDYPPLSRRVSSRECVLVLGRWPRQSCGGVVVGMMDGPALTCLARPHYCCCSSSSFIIVVLIPIKKTVCGPAGLIVSFLLRRPRRSCDCVEMLSSLKILFAYYCC